MRKFLVTLCLASLGIAGFLSTQSRAQQTEQELRARSLFLTSAAGQKNEDGLLAVVRKIVASWETMDFAKIEPYYASDTDLAYFDLFPLKYDNWAAYRAGAQKGLFDPNSSIKIKVNDDLWVHVPSENFAWRRTWPGAGRWCSRSAPKGGLSSTSTSPRR